MSRFQPSDTGWLSWNKSHAFPVGKARFTRLNLIIFVQQVFPSNSCSSFLKRPDSQKQHALVQPTLSFLADSEVCIFSPLYYPEQI